MVADNGPGIPEAMRETVFKRFVRLDGSRSTPGSGLGLSLVAAIAELHGIAITLDDNGPGLRVSLAFPASAHPQRALARASLIERLSASPAVRTTGPDRTPTGGAAEKGTSRLPP